MKQSWYFVLIILILLSFPIKAQENIPFIQKEEGLVNPSAPIIESFPNNQGSIEEAHISRRDIADWVFRKLSDILSIEAGAAEKSLQENRYLFTPDGFSDFRNFFSSQKIEAINKKDFKNISAVVVERPRIINAGKMKDIYRWLVSARILITTQDPSLLSLSNNNPTQRKKLLDEMEASKKEYDITLQIRRIPFDNGTEHQISIELFSAEFIESDF